MKWSQLEVDKLKELYPNNTNIELSNSFDRSIPSIKKKAYSLNIHKSEEYHSKIRKDRTRDLSVENLTIIAKSYKTKSDFQNHDPSAYSASSKLGIKDIICSHMINQSISRPQLIMKYIISKIFNVKILYNTRKIIKPYELDIYLPKFNLAFEYDGSYWHQDKKDIDDKKNKLCLDKNIKLFRLSSIETYYPKHLRIIKNYLKGILKELNNISGMKITKKDIENITQNDVDSFIKDEILDHNKIIEICNKYSNYKDFKTKEKSLYCKLIDLKCIKKYTQHMIKDVVYWDEELCKIEIDKFKTYKYFRQNSKKCHIYIQRNNLSYLLDVYDDFNNYSINDIIIIVDNLEIKTLKHFRIKYSNYYQFLVYHKRLDILSGLKKSHKKHHINEILEFEYSKYNSLSQFRKDNENLYKYVVRQNKLEFVKNIYNKL